MTQESKDYLKSSIIPIFLGCNKTSRHLAFMLFNKFGISSLICEKPRGIKNILSFYARIHKLYSVDNPQIVVSQLLDLAQKYCDSLLILVPCSDTFASAVSLGNDVLENHFIISSPATLFECQPIFDIK